MSPAIPEFQARVEKITTVALETKVFRLKLLGEHDSFSFVPGQFISLKVAEKVFRSYSIASAPNGLPVLELCVKIIPEGKGSMYLDALVEGDLITFRGAFGKFIVRDPQKALLLIGTGTGIAPLKAFVDEAATEKFSRPVALIFGVRHEAYAPYLLLFRNLVKTFPNFHFALCLSRPKEDDHGDLYGRVTDWVQQKEVAYFTGKDVYLCGSPAMVKEVRLLLTTEKNVLLENIFTEAY